MVGLAEACTGGGVEELDALASAPVANHLEELKAPE